MYILTSLIRGYLNLIRGVVPGGAPRFWSDQLNLSQPRAVAKSENLGGGHVILGGDNVPPLVKIGLTDLPKSGGHMPPGPPACDGPAQVLK